MASVEEIYRLLGAEHTDNCEICHNVAVLTGIKK